MAKREGVGLALSGGGYRASLFHLGALRRLHELGLLQQVTRLSSVSGGSILAGHLAQRAHSVGRSGRLDFADFEIDVAKSFRRFVQWDARTIPTLKYFGWGQLMPTLRAFALRDHLYYRLTKLRLVDLASLNVEFIFLATDMQYGTAWQFRPTVMFTWRDDKRSRNNVGNTSVATAAAASACFPPLFGPLELQLEDGRKAYLTDGGVYDNSGMEPIWLKNSVVMVSDAGKPFDFAVPKTYVKKLLRYTTIASEQVRAQRHRFLIRDLVRAKNEGRDPTGALWRMGSEQRRFKEKADDRFLHYLEAMNKGWYGYADDGRVKQRIQAVRTDLDTFLISEAGVLENHGYYMADIAAHRHLNDLLTAAPFDPPFPDLVEESRALEALRHSDNRWMFWKRWLDRKTGK